MPVAPKRMTFIDAPCSKHLIVGTKGTVPLYVTISPGEKALADEAS